MLDPARPLFDITLLGLGPDGHTASLLPGEPVLEERKRWVAAVSHGRPEVRITMTYPVIESSRQVAFLVTGKEKAPIFRAIRAGGSEVPAARVTAGRRTHLVRRPSRGHDLMDKFARPLAAAQFSGNFFFERRWVLCGHGRGFIQGPPITVEKQP